MKIKINSKTLLASIMWVLLLAFNSFASGSIVNKNPQNASPKIIHVLVALCDNQYQRIVPVPTKIGNGDDLVNNLYWGAAYGVKSYFNKSKEWKLISIIKDPRPGIILERIIFKKANNNIYLIADAYRGREIKRATADLLSFAAGKTQEQVELIYDSEKVKLNFGGQADLIAYIGHNGLMDFQLDDYPKQVNEKKRDIIILACASRNYFQNPILISGANPILWTTNFMAPEAYVLEAGVNAWIGNESLENIRLKAAQAYDKYQKCGMKGALRLFSSRW